jgi:hypothetical protein
MNADKNDELDLSGFDTLIGTWATSATHPQLEGAAPGTATFAWLEGGRFLILRTSHEHALIPNAIAVIGPPEDGDGLVMEYFDSRGVRRTYRTSLEGGLWRYWRDAPGFDQRFSATLGPDTFEGHGELARTAGEWHDDLHVSYRRTSSTPTTDGEQP